METPSTFLELLRQKYNKFGNETININVKTAIYIQPTLGIT